MVRLLQAWLWLRDKGQGLVEYALILVLIAIVVIAILALLGGRVSTVFSRITSALGGS
jgi:pilus assembly protein Flp/PilA